tara:strand:- start:1749 stop:3329 length:1581 start_codon:yes stop_codon:yes gene_type:complete
MANGKKQSFNPSTVLIAGERQVRDAKAAKTLMPASAFSQNFQKVFMAGMEENRKQQAAHEALMIDLGGIENIQYLEGENKTAVEGFLRTNRDEYAKLARLYQKTKDVNILDKMNSIKTAFSNLNTDIKTLYNDKVGYVDASDKGELIKGSKSFDQGFYDSILLGKQKFAGIDANGRILYKKPETVNMTGFKIVKYADVASKWNVKNNVAENLVLATDESIVKNAQKGFGFDPVGTKNRFKVGFKKTGSEGLQVMAETDITGDDDFVLPNGQKVGNMSFEFMWGAGMLDQKYYNKRKSGDTQWMFDNANADELNDMMAQYYTDVMQDRHKSNFRQGGGRRGGGTSFLNTGKSLYIGGGNRTIDYNTGAVLLNQFRRAAAGEPVEINVTGNKFSYDPKKNEWSDEGGNVVGSSLEKFIRGTLGINDPAFIGIKASGNVQGRFTSGVNFNLFQMTEEKAQPELQRMFPDFRFEQGGFGTDKIDVYDRSGNFVERFDFDYSNENKAKKEAERFNNIMERYLKDNTLPIIK